MKTLFSTIISVIILLIVSSSVYATDRIAIIGNNIPQVLAYTSKQQNLMEQQNYCFEAQKHFKVYQKVKIKGIEMSYQASTYISTVNIKGMLETRMDIYKSLDDKSLTYRYTAGGKTWAWSFLFNGTSRSIVDKDSDGICESSTAGHLYTPKWVISYAKKAATNFNYILPKQYGNDNALINPLLTSSDDAVSLWQKIITEYDKNPYVPATMIVGRQGFFYFGSIYENLQGLKVRIDLYTSIKGIRDTTAMQFSMYITNGKPYAYTYYLRPDMPRKYPSENFSISDSTGDGYFDIKQNPYKTIEIPKWIKEG